jgi:integral membrane sensor domain MASE1
MKEQNKNRGLLKGLILGPLIGGFLGFLVLFLISGKLPFEESYAMGLGDVKGLIAIFYLYSIIGGAILGFVVGIIIGSIVDYMNK